MKGSYLNDMLNINFIERQLLSKRCGVGTCVGTEDGRHGVHDDDDDGGDDDVVVY